MNWRRLVHNRKVQLAAGGAAGLAGWVWLRRRRAAGSSSTPPPAGAAAFAGQAWPDTSGTDVAGWLGNYSGALQSQLDAYGKQIGDALHPPAPTPDTPTPAGPVASTPESSGRIDVGTAPRFNIPLRLGG